MLLTGILYYGSLDDKTLLERSLLDLIPLNNELSKVAFLDLSPYLSAGAFARICDRNETLRGQYVSGVGNPSRITMDKMNEKTRIFAEELAKVPIAGVWASVLIAREALTNRRGFSFESSGMIADNHFKISFNIEK
jgi:hypothetical protein